MNVGNTYSMAYPEYNIVFSEIDKDRPLEKKQTASSEGTKKKIKEIALTILKGIGITLGIAVALGVIIGAQCLLVFKPFIFLAIALVVLVALKINEYKAEKEKKSIGKL